MATTMKETGRREREVIEALDKGGLPQGVRIVVSGEETGVTFALSPAEAKQLVGALRKIASDRLSAQKGK